MHITFIPGRFNGMMLNQRLFPMGYLLHARFEQKDVAQNPPGAQPLLEASHLCKAPNTFYEYILFMERKMPCFRHGGQMHIIWN